MNTIVQFRTDDGCRRPLFPGADRCADRHPRQGVRLRQEGLKCRCCSHSSRFRFDSWRGDGGGGRARRARLLSCRARRSHRGRAARHRRIGVVGAVENSRLRLFEAGERKRAGRRRDCGTPCGLCAHGRGMAARRSNRSADRRPCLDLRSRRAEPAFRVGFFLFNRHRSACRHQARRWAKLPQAMQWRGRSSSDWLTATVGLSCFTAGQLAVPHAIVKGGSAPGVVAKVAHARA